jgi:TPR repeat protein
VRIRTLPKCNIFALLLFACGLSGLTQITQAQSSYELGDQAYRNKQFKEAREYWEDSASEGNLSATFNLGLLLYKGIGGPGDAQRAVTLFRRVADAGLAVGQNTLASAYYSGNGIAKDNEQARIWWERAARQNHTKAQLNLGILLWKGEGVHKDVSEAVKWFRKASDAGNLQARAYLDTILEQADVTSPAEPLDTPISDTNPVISNILQKASLAHQQQDYETAFSLWYEAAERGNAIAQYQLARLYHDGLGTRQDLSLAFKNIQSAAQQNLAQAQYRLAQYYLDGEQVTKNETLALFWMQSAADQGHLKAKDHLERLR